MIIKNMKKQTKNFKNLFFINLIAIVFLLSSVYAADKVAENITDQAATGS
jgi:hypothetical protein